MASDDVPIGDVAPAETADDQALGSKESSASAFESGNQSYIPTCVDTTVSCESIVDVTRDVLPASTTPGAAALDEISGPFCIEFCSGTAGLTAALRRHGFKSSFGIDKIVKSGCKATVIKLDLCDQSSRALAREWLLHKNMVYAHFGVPCGTASRAREIYIEDGPVPLRSLEEPDGISSLDGVDLLRVLQANQIYETACMFIILCHFHNKHWSLEQPARSLFWQTSFWKAVLRVLQPIYVTFHNCMWGGQRPKQTTLATDMTKLYDLACECDRQHLHLPWGRTPQGFATAAEVEYPHILCQEWARLVSEVIAPSLPLQEHSINPCHPDKKARAITGKQTKHSSAFIREYDEVKCCKLHSLPQGVHPRQKMQHDVCRDDNIVIPQHSRVLRVKDNGGDGDSSKDRFEVAFGVPWTEHTFIAEAVKKGHPSNIFDALSPGIIRAIEANCKWKPEEVILHRARWLKKWTNRAMELAKEEHHLHDRLPPHRKKILEGKRLLVLKEILEDEGYPDVGLVQEIEDGFDLVGISGESEALPPDFQPASISQEELLASSDRSNKAVIHSTKGSGSDLIDSELWAKTMEEVGKGWLTGPHTSFQTQGRVSRRFAVVQSQKVRPVDNYSESQVNDAVTITNRCTVDGVDTIAACGAVYLQGLLKRSPFDRLLGRSFDLKSAYRQLAVSDSSLKWARLAVYDPEAKCSRVFQQYSLPFGAKASVIAFIRCARMIQFLAHRLLIVTTCYFDDYVVFSKESLSKNTELTFATLLDILGWKFDKSGDKADTMSTIISALGVEFCLEEAKAGIISVQNTAKRKKELTSQISEALSAGKLSASAAASLKGRLGFAEGQLFGRSTRKLVNELGRHSLAPPRNGILADATSFALRFVQEKIEKSRPRIVDVNSREVIYVFTDAAFESEALTGGLGAVLLSSSGEVIRWAGQNLDSSFIASIIAEDQKQFIGELETLAVLAAISMWRDWLTAKHVVFFIDNEASRFCILKGYSKNPCISKMVHALATLEEEVGCFAWYARVPSEANIADPPSRGSSHMLLPEEKRQGFGDLVSLW